MRSLCAHKPEDMQSMLFVLVCHIHFFATFLVQDCAVWHTSWSHCWLSTWFGDWLASQFPNASWHHPMCLNTLKIVAHMCHYVPSLGTPCHLHVCGMLGEPCCINYLACTSNLKKVMCFYKYGALVLHVTPVQTLWIFKTKNFHSGGCHMLAGFCQLEFWKGLLLRHALIGQTRGTTSWD